jgi:hypothetical protein
VVEEGIEAVAEEGIVAVAEEGVVAEAEEAVGEVLHLCATHLAIYLLASSRLVHLILVILTHNASS